ncbi:MAG: YARHG domain-containing protein [Lachnospiraceae bacterium]|nr:YARHG domain-containing protein [Lachnospiraceae bacterium]
MYCSRCGTKVSNGTASCPECGQDLSYESSSIRMNPGRGSGGKKRKRRGAALRVLVPAFALFTIGECVWLLGIAPGRVEQSSTAQLEAEAAQPGQGIRELIPTYAPEEIAAAKEPDPTEEPTPTPTVTPAAGTAPVTAVPLETPLPTPTPTETPTPTPTETPTPTPTPTETPTPTPTPEETPVPTPEETPVPVTGEDEVVISVQGDGYVLPGSASSKISESDLSGLSAEELRIARNEIYARHGLIFKSPELQDYFSQLDWYHGTVENAQDIALSEVEAENVNTINNYEQQHGMNR